MPGAVKPTDVAKTPSGFDKAVTKKAAVNYENDVPDLDDIGMYSDGRQNAFAERSMTNLGRKWLCIVLLHDHSRPRLVMRRS